MVHMDLRIIAVKGYFILPRFPELKFHNQMQFSVISETPFFCSAFALCRGYLIPLTRLIVGLVYCVDRKFEAKNVCFK